MPLNNHNPVVDLATVGAKPELPEEDSAAQRTSGCGKCLVVEAVGNSGAMKRKQATRVGLRRGVIDMPQPGANREGRRDPGRGARTTCAWVGPTSAIKRRLSSLAHSKTAGVTVCCGSLGPPGSLSHAVTFFAGLDVEALDFTEAVSWFEEGLDPMAAPVPMHPSFEDRPAVPDRVFASIDDHDYRHQIAVWRSVLERIGPPDLYHVHHLTHVNDALLAFSHVPVVVHLHGTELKHVGPEALLH